MGPKTGESAAKTVAAMRRLSEETRALAAYDQRIQDEQELGTIYRDWQTAVGNRQRRSVHGMLQSAISFSAAPAISVRPTAMGVSVLVRYITRAHERYEVRSRRYASVVEVLRKQKIPERPANA